MIAAKPSLFVLLKNPRCPLKWSLKGLNLNIYINNSYLKGSASQLYKLVFKDSPYIQKPRVPILNKVLSSIHIPFKTPCHDLCQPLVVRNRLLELATARGSQLLVVCNWSLEIATARGTVFESWFMYWCRNLRKRKVPYTIAIFNFYLHKCEVDPLRPVRRVHDYLIFIDIRDKHQHLRAIIRKFRKKKLSLCNQNFE